MSDTTTIEIKDEQKNELDDLKQHERESYKAVLARLLTEDTQSVDAPDVDVDADELAARIVDQIGADVGGPQVDDSELAKAVAEELDYAYVADKVADKVVGELR